MLKRIYKVYHYESGKKVYHNSKFLTRKSARHYCKRFNNKKMFIEHPDGKEEVYTNNINNL